MLDKLNQLVKENAQEAIVNNSEIPNDKNEAVMQAASGSIFDALKQQVSSGNVSQLVETFQGGTTATNPVVEQASAGFTDKLAGMGINLQSAKGIAAAVIPGIISKFIQKTNDPNDRSFDVQDILSNISGSDGKFQASDLTNMFNKGKTGAGNAGDEQGGLGDKLKGLF